MSVSMPADMIIDKGEKHLFNEVVEDIAFALNNLEMEEQRKQAEIVLRESEERFAGFIKSATDGIVMYDSDLNLIEINKAALEIFPAETIKEKLIGNNILEIVPSLKESGRYDKYLNVLKTGEPLLFNDLVPGPKFGKRHLTVKAFKVGEGLGIIFRDITEHKKAEEEIKETKTILQNVLDHTHMMAVYLDSKFNFIWVNPTYAKTCKYPQSFFPGKNHFNLYPNKENQEIFQNVVDTGKPFSIEAKSFEFPDQPERGITYWDWSLFPIQDAKNKVTGLVFTLAEVTEKKKTEQALKEGKEILDQSQKISLVGSWSLNVKSGEVIWSDELYRMFGIDPQKGPPSWPEGHKKYYHPDDWEWASKKIAKFIGMGKSYDFVDRIIKSDGTIHYTRVIGKPFFNLDGKVGKYIGTIQDITEGKKTEDELRLHSKLLTNMDEGVYLIRASDSIIVYTNPAFERMFGYDPGEIVGKNVSIINAPIQKDPEGRAKEIIEVLNKTGKWEGEVNNIKKDGTSIWCYAIVSTFEHYEYGPVWISVHTDITERKQAVEKLRESDDRFRVALKNSKITVFTQDRDLRFTWAYNPTPGFDTDMILGKTDEDLVGTEQASRTMEIKRLVLETGKGTREELSTIVDGKTLYYDLTVESLYDDNGEITGIVCASIDITERKNLEQELKDYNLRLEDIVKKRTVELQERVAELERFHEATIDRELRMKELRDEIEKLKKNSL